MNNKERGIPLVKHRFWTEMRNKENFINLKSFSKHQKKYEELAQAEVKSLVTPEMLKEMKENKLSLVKTIERFPYPISQYPTIMPNNCGTVPTPWNYRAYRYK